MKFAEARSNAPWDRSRRYAFRAAWPLMRCACARAPRRWLQLLPLPLLPLLRLPLLRLPLQLPRLQLPHPLRLRLHQSLLLLLSLKIL